MKKLLFIATLALATLSSCKKEEGLTQVAVSHTDVAYLSVKIASADKHLPLTKGTGTTPAFYYGSAEEHKVYSADFYFYNEDGSYAMHVNQGAPTGTENGAGTQTTDNIEWKGDGTIVLRGLKSKAYPSYMAVLLNADATLSTSLEHKPMSSAYNTVAEAIAQTATAPTAWTKFLMTSSTFNNGDAKSGYFCTKLTPDNFQETEAAAKAQPVVAYVERLAAKVQTSNGAAHTDGLYEIGDFALNGTATTEKLYAKVEGWGLNATQKTSYIYKHLMVDWSLGTFTWNDAANFRSYWAASPNYQDATAVYPQNVAQYTADLPLSYISYSALGVTMGQAAYCRENTNTSSILQANNFNTTVTSVLLKAKVCKADGVGLSLARYDGTLYELEAYKDRVLAKYKALGASTFIPWVSSDGTTFTEVDKSYFELANAGDGRVTLKFKALTGVEKYYQHTGTGITAADFTEKTADEATAMLNGVGASKNTTCELYNDGMMYYNVPVEHLRNSGISYKDASYTFPEADYGVVRNHYYLISIENIRHLGTAVFDPDEIIVPNDENDKEYYVGAQINILSWKVVSQSVDL